MIKNAFMEQRGNMQDVRGLCKKGKKVIVVDNIFNKTWYNDIIGNIYEEQEAPSYAIVGYVDKKEKSAWYGMRENEFQEGDMVVNRQTGEIGEVKEKYYISMSDLYEFDVLYKDKIDLVREEQQNLKSFKKEEVISKDSKKVGNRMIKSGVLYLKNTDPEFKSLAGPYEVLDLEDLMSEEIIPFFVDETEVAVIEGDIEDSMEDREDYLNNLIDAFREGLVEINKEEYNRLKRIGNIRRKAQEKKENKLLNKSAWEFSEDLDFRFIEGTKIINNTDSIYYAIEALSVVDWANFLDILARYGVAIEYDNEKDIYIVANNIGKGANKNKISNDIFSELRISIKNNPDNKENKLLLSGLLAGYEKGVYKEEFIYDKINDIIATGKKEVESVKEVEEDKHVLAYNKEEIKEEIDNIIEESIAKGMSSEYICNILLDIKDENYKSYLETFIGNSFGIRQYIDNIIEEKIQNSFIETEADIENDIMNTTEPLARVIEVKTNKEQDLSELIAQRKEESTECLGEDYDTALIVKDIFNDYLELSKEKKVVKANVKKSNFIVPAEGNNLKYIPQIKQEDSFSTMIADIANTLY